MRARAFDPLRLDVFRHLFAAAAEEMGAALLTSSFSPNIRERRDFSCALFDGNGRMIGQAAHVVDCIHWYMNAGFPEAVTCAGGKIHLQGVEIPETTTMMACLGST